MEPSRKVKEKLNGLDKPTLRLVESNGSTLGNMLTKSDLWAGQLCIYPDCKNCINLKEGTMSDCKVRSVIYKSVCMTCEANGLKATYFGETSQT